MKYIKYSDFCAKVENNDKSVLENFSLNPENFKLCIAREESTTIHYSNDSEIDRSGGGISKEELNYQTYLQNYAVPLNFFTTLHVIAQDKEFMEEFVKMATGGDDPEPIILTYVETRQEYTTTYNYEGTAQRTITLTDVSTNGANFDENSVRTTYTEEQIAGIRAGTTTIGITNNNVHDYYSGAPKYDKEVIISNSGSLYITKANTWLKSSEKQVSEMQIEDNGGSTQENYPIEDLPKQVYNYTDLIMDKSKNNAITKIMNTKLIMDSFKETIVASSKTSKYTVVDLKSEIVVDEFINLIKSYPKVENNISTTPSNIFYSLQQNENTQRLEKIMRYVLYVLNDVDYGVTKEDLEFLLEDNALAVGGMTGGTIGEKIWFALLAKGYSKEATAGVLGNLSVESAGLVANRLQFDYAQGGAHAIPPGYTDETYTAAVDGGTYTKDEFVHDAAGYGLAQWTWYTRKEGLYLYAKSQGVSIGDENMQIEYLLGELGHSEYASGYAKRMIGSNHGFTVENWTEAATPEEAAEAFCWIYENPIAYSSSRATRAREYYERYKDLEEGGTFQSGGSGSVIGTFTSGITGRTFTIFNQNQIPGWGDRCNRAAQISVCSGYYARSAGEWISVANNAPDNSMPTYQPIYEPCGLSCAYQPTGSTFDTQKIKNQIQSGGYVIIYLKGSKAGHSGVSNYGRKWASSMHWVAILGYKVEDGQEKIFVSDSGHGNTGWWPIDEFNGMVSNVLFVNLK